MQSAGVIIHDFILHSPMLQRMLLLRCELPSCAVAGATNRQEKFLERVNWSHHAAA